MCIIMPELLSTQIWWGRKLATCVMIRSGLSSRSMAGSTRWEALRNHSTRMEGVRAAGAKAASHRREGTTFVAMASSKMLDDKVRDSLQTDKPWGGRSHFRKR
jgi:hypothetical protein